MIAFPQWRVFHQGLVRNDDAGGMHGRIAGDPFQALGNLKHVFQAAVGSQGFAQFFIVFINLGQRKFLGGRRHQLGDFVGFGKGQPEHASDVFENLAPLGRAESGDLRDVVGAAIALGHVFDDFATPIHAKVDVDVGHGLTAGVQKAFEQQAILQRVEIGNPQGKTHQTAGCGAATWTDGDAVFLGPPDKVGDDEKIAAEPHVADDAHFETKALPIGVFLRIVEVNAAHVEFDEALEQALTGRILDHGLFVFARRGKVRNMKFAEIKFERATFGDAQRIFQGFRNGLEGVPHFVGMLDVKLVVGKFHAVGVFDGFAGADAEQAVMRKGIVFAQIVIVVGRHQADTEILRQGNFGAIDLVLLVKAIGLNFQVKTVRAKQIAKHGGLALGFGGVVLHDGLGDFTLQAARKAD